MRPSLRYLGMYALKDIDGFTQLVFENSLIKLFPAVTRVGSKITLMLRVSPEVVTPRSSQRSGDRDCGSVEFASVEEAVALMERFAHNYPESYLEFLGLLKSHSEGEKA